MIRSVSVTENGRSGQVTYHEGRHAIDGSWEFGGGDVVAIVSMGSAGEWLVQHPWAVSRRAEILDYVAGELLRLKAPTCSAEIDRASGDILLRGAEAGIAAGVIRTVAAAPGDQRRVVVEDDTAWFWRYARLKGRVGVVGLAIALAVGAAWWVKSRVLVVRAVSGVPFGPVVRTDAHLASLIDTRQPYTPSLNHNSSTPRFTLGRVLVPLDGSAPQLVELKSDLRAGGYSLARVIGTDGRTMWVDADGLVGVDLGTYRRVTADDVKAANPGLDARWIDDTRRMDIVDGRLHMLSDDHSDARALDPGSLRAARVPPMNLPRPSSNPPLTLYMAAGLRVSNTAWLGLQSEADLAGEYRRGQWLRAVESATDTPRDTRMLVRGTLEPEASDPGDLRRIATMTPMATTAYRNASFLRLSQTSEPIRVAGPDSVLMLHTSGDGTGTSSTLLVSRVVVDSGEVQWTHDTGLHRFLLQQILPGERTTVFVGTRPPIPDKLSEPLLVILDHAGGQLVTHSLWR
ncbi:MAG: hypothetical protein U0P30_10630 [Vicinamibacterales bacterium]